MTFTIPLNQLKDGAEFCLENGLRLLEDGEILFMRGRYLTASFLGLSACEEVAKGEALLQHYNTGQGMTKKTWYAYKRNKPHVNKLKKAYELDTNYLRSKFSSVKMSDISTKKREWIYELIAAALQRLKLQSFYVDWKDNKWQLPKNAISKKQKVAAAFMHLSSAGRLCMVLADKLERDVSRLEKRLENLCQKMIKVMDKITEEENLRKL